MSPGNGGQAAGRRGWASLLRNLRHNRILTSSAGMMMNQAVNVILNLVLMAILARSLSMHDMGRYQLILAFIAFGQIAGLPGMDVVINKAIIKKFDGLVLPALRTSFVSALIVCLLLCVAGIILVSTHWNGEIGKALLLVSAFIPMKGLEKYDAILLGKKEFRLARRINTLSSILSIFTMGPVAYFTNSMEFVVLALFLVKGTTLAIGLKLAIARLEKQPMPPGEREALLRQGWGQTLFNIIGIMVGQVDKVILGLMEPRLLAIYYMGSVIPTRIKDNVKSLFGVVTAYWSAHSKEENLAKIRRNTGFIALFGASLTAFVWVVSPYFIPFLYGPDYRDSIRVSQMLSISLGLNCYTYFFATMDVYQNTGKAWNIQNTARQALYLLLLAALVPRYSVQGVVAAILASDFMNAALSYLQMRKNMPVAVKSQRKEAIDGCRP